MFQCKRRVSIWVVKIGARENRIVLTGVNKCTFRHVPVYRMTFGK